MTKTSRNRIGRREFLRHGSAAVAAGLLGFAHRAGAGTHQRPHVMDEPNVHNMLIVGQGAVFLSHLPMFSDPDFVSPHRYQAILEATFSKAGADAQAVYANDRKKNPSSRIYTLSPDEFILPNLTPHDGQAPVSSFKAKIFRGHLEKPGKRLLVSGVNVSVKNLIHFREFDPQAENPAQLKYILFGKGKELFLAHFITKPPDFDQVLSVTVSDHNFTDEELGKGLLVAFERPNSIPQRLIEKQEAVGEVRDGGGTANPFKASFKAGREFYFEEGELRVPAVLDVTTAAESKAGFP